MNKKSVYSGSEFIITTLHNKAEIVAPSFFKKLGASVIEFRADTDLLGTFSGEKDRKGSFLECAKIKCEMGLSQGHADYGLASEGSFGPHPYIPFLMMNAEILYFIDRLRGFHLYLTHTSEKTNYAGSIITSFSELEAFAKKSLFPSHGIIVRPYFWENKTIIFKGIQSEKMLKEAFDFCSRNSVDGSVWAETDMRAHMNPSRAVVIKQLADKMAERLSALCPDCTMPGWGISRPGQRLSCPSCLEQTEVVKSDLFGCVKCNYQEDKDRLQQFVGDLSQYCINCNP